MKRTAIFLGLASAMTGPAGATEVYRCEIDGVMSFSQQPCAENAQRLEVNYIRPSAADIARQEERSRRTVETNREMAQERQIREIGYDIESAAGTIRTLQRQRDIEVAQLRRKKDSANNNLAGATWENSITQEMEAVIQRYDSLISQHQADIDRWREDLQSMGKQ